MTNKTLRSLAKDYAQGVSDREAYCKARTDLIEGIISGKIKVASIDFPPPIDLEEGDPTVESAITKITPEQFTKRPKPPQPAPPPPAPSREAHHHWLIGSGIVALLCLVVLIILFVGDKNAVKKEESSFDYELSDQSVQGTNATLRKTAADYHIEGFLNQNNWSDEFKQQFIINWESLSIQEQTAALNSTSITRLSNAIYKQLLDERALLGLGNNSEVIAKQQALVDFANKIGIHDARLTVKGEVENPVKTDTETTENNTVSKIQPSDTKTKTETAPTPGTAKIPQEDPAAESSENETQDETSNVEPTPTVVAKESTIKDVPDNSAAANSGSEVSSTDSLKSTSNKNACKAELARQRKPYCRDEINGIGNGPTLVVIRSGKFTMGGQKQSELPVHEVTIGYPFALSVNEITFGEFQLFCNATQPTCPEQPWVGKDYPVVNVSWLDVQSYVKWLSEKTGNVYRLPSETEWEYAARAGTMTIYPFGDEILITDAVFSDRKQLSSPLPKTDRTINRNKFRLYHMMGNVREWVADNWRDDYSSASTDGSAFENGGQIRVIRGGSFNDNADALRSGARDKLPADSRDKFTGFRVLQELKL